MKPTTICRAAGLSVFLITSSAWADVTERSASASQASKRTEAIQGRVQAVDAERNVVTLSDGRQFELAPDAPVMKDGQVATLHDIAQGDDVWASFEHGSSRTMDELGARTPVGQILDGIPQTREQEFLHEVWTSGG